MDDAIARHGGELFQRLPSTASEIKDRVVFAYRDMAEAPIREPPMPPVHRPQDEPTDPSAGMLTLARRLLGLRARECDEGHAVSVR